MQKLDRLMIKYILFIALLILLVFNYEQAFTILERFMTILSPIIVGVIMAYILNILMVKFERIWFPRNHNKWVKGSRRPLSILFAILTITIVLVIILGLVIPQLLGVLATLMEIIPLAIEQTQGWITTYEERFPEMGVIFDQFEINWGQIVQDAVGFFNSVTTRIVESTLEVIGSITSVIINLFLSLIISIYLLLSKEKLLMQANRILKAYFSKVRFKKIRYVLEVADESFSHFITGEALEAFILGMMVFVGMWIFRFPYETMLGALTGVMALIPMVGAWISGSIGFVLIVVQSPIQGLAFLIFIILIQQIEGNIIYPKIVGDKIGLPGMWVLIAVTVGAGLGGILGMLVSVPIASTVYKLLQQNIMTREKMKVVNSFSH